MRFGEDRAPSIKRCENALRDVLDFLYPGGKGVEMFERMMERHGSVGAIIAADKHLLKNEGLRESDALLITLLPDVVRHIERAKFGAHPYIRTLVEAERFMSVRYLGLYIEKFHMLALDARGRLIELVHLQDGSEDSAPFYLRHVMAAVVRTGAKAIVLTHNHPNLSAKPSPDDIECTKTLINALSVLGIPLIDHMIMVGHEALSVRGFGYIPEKIWVMQDPAHKVLRGWFKDWDMEQKAERLARLDSRH